MSDKTLQGRLIEGLEWAHKNRVKVRVKQGPIHVNLYFSGDESPSGVQILLAIVNAIEDAKQNPRIERLEKTVKEEDLPPPNVPYEDIEDFIK